jgi:hypothetical protein
VAVSLRLKLGAGGALCFVIKSRSCHGLLSLVSRVFIFLAIVVVLCAVAVAERRVVTVFKDIVVGVLEDNNTEAVGRAVGLPFFVEKVVLFAE